MIRGLFQDTVVYGVSAALSRSVGLLIMPIIARHLGSVEYGVVALSGVIAALLGVVGDLQISAGMGRYYHEEPDEIGRRKLIGTGLCVVAAFSLLLAFVTAVACEPISLLVLGDRSFRDAVLVAAFQVPFQVLLAYLLYVLRLAARRSAYVTSSMVSAAGGALVSVLLVTLTDLGWRGAVLGIASGQVIGFVAAVVWARRYLSLTMSHPALRRMLAYGLPSLPGVAGAAIQQAFGQVFLARCIGLSEVGIYAVGLRVSQIVGVFQTSFSLSWYPFLLKSLHEDSRRDACRTGLSLYFALGLPLLCGLSVFAPELVSLLAGAAYAPAAMVVPVLCLAEFVVGLVPVVNTGIIASKRTYLASLAYGVSVVVTVGGTLWLARSHGSLGAAAALAAGRVAHILSTEGFSRLIRQGLSDWSAVVVGVCGACLVTLIGGLSWSGAWPLRLALGAGISILSLLFVYRWRTCAVRMRGQQPGS